MTGIRLKGGAPIPPAPSLGPHQPVTAGGLTIGSIVETRLAVHVPVCAHKFCRLALEPRISHRLAAGSLYLHWDTAHPGDAE